MGGEYLKYVWDCRGEGRQGGWRRASSVRSLANNVQQVGCLRSLGNAYKATLKFDLESACAEGVQFANSVSTLLPAVRARFCDLALLQAGMYH